MDDKGDFYTHGHHPVVTSAHAKRTVADSAQFLLPYLDADVRLLDFGCGPGSITVELADFVGPGGSVVGVDTSPDAIALARRGPVPGNVEFRVASVYDLPFPDASFDVGYGHQVLQHLSDPMAALTEVARVLRPGGLVAVRDSDYGTMTHHPHYAELDLWLDLYRSVARSNGGEPDAGRRLVSWVRQAGLNPIAVTTSTWTYSTPEERLDWAKLWSERIRLPRFAERAAALGRGDEVDSIAAAWLRWAAEPDGWFAFIHGELIAAKARD